MTDSLLVLKVHKKRNKYTFIQPFFYSKTMKLSVQKTSLKQQVIAYRQHVLIRNLLKVALS